MDKRIWSTDTSVYMRFGSHINYHFDVADMFYTLYIINVPINKKIFPLIFFAASFFYIMNI